MLDKYADGPRNSHPIKTLRQKFLLFSVRFIVDVINGLTE